MSEVVFIAKWTLAVLAFWTLCSIAAALLWWGLAEWFRWRATRRPGVYGRGWGDL